MDFLQGDYSKAREKLDWRPTIRFDQLVTRMTEHDLDLAQREAHALAFVGEK